MWTSQWTEMSTSSQRWASTDKYSAKYFISDIKRSRGQIKSSFKFFASSHTCSVAHSCLTLCDPMDCNPPGSSVYRNSQARILEWVAISSSRGSSWPGDWTCMSFVGRQVLYHCTNLDISTWLSTCALFHFFICPANINWLSPLCNDLSMLNVIGLTKLIRKWSLLLRRDL